MRSCPECGFMINPPSWMCARCHFLGWWWDENGNHLPRVNTFEATLGSAPPPVVEAQRKRARPASGHKRRKRDEPLAGQTTLT